MAVLKELIFLKKYQNDKDFSLIPVTLDKNRYFYRVASTANTGACIFNETGEPATVSGIRNCITDFNQTHSNRKFVQERYFIDAVCAKVINLQHQK